MSTHPSVASPQRSLWSFFLSIDWFDSWSFGFDYKALWSSDRELKSSIKWFDYQFIWHYHLIISDSAMWKRLQNVYSQMKQTRLKPLSQPIWQPPPLHPVSYHLNLLPTVGYLRFLYVSSSVKTPLSFSDNQAETCLIITSNDTSLEYLPLIINISDTCKNQLKRLDFDNAFNLSSLWSIVILASPCSRSWTLGWYVEL